MSRNLPWFRMYADAVDNEKLRMLAYEDRWHYVAILCLKCQGVLDSGGENLLERKIAVKLGVQLRELDEIKRRLVEVELIDENYQPTGWEEKQFRSDRSTDRVRRYRERQRKSKRNGDETLQKRSGNATVTAQDTDTDTDTEKEKEKDKETKTEKKQTKSRCKKFNPMTMKPDNISEKAWQALIEHRKAKKAANTEMAYRLLLGQFDKASKDHAVSAEHCIRTMILRDWRGFQSDWMGKKQPGVDEWYDVDENGNKIIDPEPEW